jgi:hypothetical protein
MQAQANNDSKVNSQTSKRGCKSSSATQTTHSGMHSASPGMRLIFFLTTKLCTTLPFFNYRPHNVHVLDHRIVIQIYESAICKQQSAVFQIVLVQQPSLVQLLVVKQENSSSEQITCHIFIYCLYVTFHKLFVGGSSQHIPCLEHHFSG